MVYTSSNKVQRNVTFNNCAKLPQGAKEYRRKKTLTYQGSFTGLAEGAK
jgi:hypothetical protein